MQLYWLLHPQCYVTFITFRFFKFYLPAVPSLPPSYIIKTQTCLLLFWPYFLLQLRPHHICVLQRWLTPMEAVSLAAGRQRGGCHPMQVRSSGVLDKHAVWGINKKWRARKLPCPGLLSSLFLYTKSVIAVGRCCQLHQLCLSVVVLKTHFSENNEKGRQQINTSLSSLLHRPAALKVQNNTNYLINTVLLIPQQTSS
jgi:hypothetical protein